MRHLPLPLQPRPLVSVHIQPVDPGRRRLRRTHLQHAARAFGHDGKGVGALYLGQALVRPSGRHGIAQCSEGKRWHRLCGGSVWRLSYRCCRSCAVALRVQRGGGANGIAAQRKHRQGLAAVHHEEGSGEENGSVVRKRDSASSSISAKSLKPFTASSPAALVEFTGQRTGAPGPQ